MEFIYDLSKVLKFLEHTILFMKIQFYFFCIAIIIFCKSANAQTGNILLNYKAPLANQEDCIEITKRKLVVMTLSYNEGYYKLLVKKGKLEIAESIKKQTDSINNLLRETVEQYWPLHSNIEYKTYNEVKSMHEREIKNIVVLTIPRYDIQVQVGKNGDTEVNVYYTIDDEYERDTTVGRGAGMHFRSLVLVPIEDFAEDFNSINKLYWGIRLPHFLPTKVDLKYAIDVCACFVQQKINDPEFSNRSLRKNILNLDGYTIAMNENNWNKEIPLDSAMAHFPYPMELMSDTEFSNLVLNGQQGYAYFIKYAHLTAIMFSDTRSVCYFPDNTNYHINKGMKTRIIDFYDLNQLNEDLVEYGEKALEEKAKQEKKAEKNKKNE